MNCSIIKPFLLVIAGAFLAMVSCTSITDAPELYGDKAPEVGFMSTTKTQMVTKLGDEYYSATKTFYEKISDYKSGADSTKARVAEVVRYPGQTDNEAYRLYVMLDDLLCASVIVFNTKTPEFITILTNYLNRYFRIDFQYILETTGMDVEPADLDSDHQYLLDMFESDMYLSKTQPEEEADTFDEWINTMIGYSMIIRSEFPYREGTGDYSLLTYLDVSSIVELAKIYDRLGFIDFILEQVPTI